MIQIRDEVKNQMFNKDITNTQQSVREVFEYLWQKFQVSISIISVTNHGTELKILHRDWQACSIQFPIQPSPQSGSFLKKG